MPGRTATVRTAVDGFVLNLFEAVAIVVVLLVIFMGLREGIIIGAVLLVTILATFISMQIFEVNLQRISLGALIIAILAFAAISLSRDVTGEFLGSLFKVIALALGLSWVFAVTVVPYLCVAFIPDRVEAAEHDLYDNSFFRGYRAFLQGCIRLRWLTMLVVIVMLAGAIYGFGFVKQNFFPGSTRPQFIVDLTPPEGSHISYTDAELRRAATYLRSLEGVTDVTTFAGGGALRFILTYVPEMPNSAYGQLLVTVRDYRQIDNLIPLVRSYLREHQPNAIGKVEKFRSGRAARLSRRAFPDRIPGYCATLENRRCRSCGPMTGPAPSVATGANGSRSPRSAWRAPALGKQESFVRK